MIWNEDEEGISEDHYSGGPMKLLMSYVQFPFYVRLVFNSGVALQQANDVQRIFGNIPCNRSKRGWRDAVGAIA
jgi:hypothetical protein